MSEVRKSLTHMYRQNLKVVLCDILSFIIEWKSVPFTVKLTIASMILIDMLIRSPLL